MVDPERHQRVVGDAAEPRQGRRVAVDHGYQRGARAEPAKQPLDPAGLAARQRHLPLSVEAVGRGDREQPRAGHILADCLMGCERFRGDRAAIGDCQLGIGAGLAQPISTADDLFGQRRIRLALGLLHRPRRQAEIDRLAVLPLDLGQRPAQQYRQLVGIGRLEADKPRLRETDQRFKDRLVGAAFRGEGDAGGGGHQDEAGVLVERVIQRVEPALDERVVERADRQ